MCKFSNIYLLLSEKQLILWEIQRKVLLGTPFWSTISSLLHLVGLQPRVYYTLTNFRGGGKAPLAPPLNTPMLYIYYMYLMIYEINYFSIWFL